MPSWATRTQRSGPRPAHRACCHAFSPGAHEGSPLLAGRAPGRTVHHGCGAAVGHRQLHGRPPGGQAGRRAPEAEPRAAACRRRHRLSRQAVRERLRAPPPPPPPPPPPTHTHTSARRALTSAPLRPGCGTASRRASPDSASRLCFGCAAPAPRLRRCGRRLDGLLPLPHAQVRHNEKPPETRFDDEDEAGDEESPSKAA